MRRPATFRIIITLGLFLGSRLADAHISSGIGDHAKGKPNLLWIVSDDLGWDDLGFRNGNQIHTPVIDRLARSGMVLDNYYVQPSCSPTRTTFMSGRYPLHHGVNSYIPPQKSYGLPLNETTVAQLLGKRGYVARAVGKWHCGSMSYSYTPTFRGFESFYGFYGGGEDYFTHMNGNAFDLRRDKRAFCGKGCSHIAVEDYGKYSTTLFTSEAVSIIDNHDQRSPLFLYLAYQAVHSPDQVPAHYMEDYDGAITDKQRHIFAGMLSALDEGVGNVTKALRAKGMLDDTFIIFTTDNGGPSETCAITGTSNYPHRGSKCSVWEGGTRGTALVHGPGLKKSGMEYKGLMHAADWLPTIMGMIGEPVTHGETLPLDGVNQWSTISEGYGTVRNEVYYGVTDTEIGMHGPAFRSGDMKLIVGKTGGLPGHWPKPANHSSAHHAEVSASGSVTASRHERGQKFPPLINISCALYNMSSDENEHVDIAQNHPIIVQRLLSRVKEITHGMACMDCSDSRCPDPVKSQIEVTLPSGKVVKAWEPYCDNVTDIDFAVVV